MNKKRKLAARKHRKDRERRKTRERERKLLAKRT